MGQPIYRLLCQKMLGDTMNTVLFDLDGTLLPMDQTKFVESYLHDLGQKFVPYGYKTDDILKAIWEGTKQMIFNDGSVTNERKFWKTFCSILGEDAAQLEHVFETFYKNEFNRIGDTITPNPLAKQCVDELIDKGYMLILSTNPLFPRVATYARVGWAGLTTNKFQLITTYENSSFSKPNLEYYKEILTQMGRTPEECLMVGNDVIEDMCAAQLGMAHFLVTDHIAHGEGADLTQFRHGSFDDLAAVLEALPALE